MAICAKVQAILRHSLGQTSWGKFKGVQGGQREVQEKKEVANSMATKTLSIDSRTKISRSNSDFKVDLPEQLNLRGARVRVDNNRTTDTFKTVSARNRYAFCLDGSSGLTSVGLDEAAYTGGIFATEVAAESSRTCTYVVTSSSLKLSYAAATRIVGRR